MVRHGMSRPSRSPSFGSGRRVRARRFQPCLLGLEPRLCLDASLSFKAGTLTVLGTDKPDAIAVHGPADPNSQGPKDGVTVVANGKAYTFSDVRRLLVRTLGGDDIVSVTGLTVTGSITLDTGDGNDTGSFDHNAYFNSTDVVALLGDGTDTLTETEDTYSKDATLKVVDGLQAGFVTLQCDEYDGAYDARFVFGTGDAVLRVSGEPGPNGMMMGNTYNGPVTMRAEMPGGNGTISLQCNTVHSGFDLRVAMGDGLDRFLMEGMTIDGPSRLNVDMGGGGDNASIIGTGARGPSDWQFALGDGADTFLAQENTFGIVRQGFIDPVRDQFAVDAGPGNDTVSLSANSDYNDSQTDVDLGEGNNRFEWSENTNDGPTAIGVVGAAGNDTVALTCDVLHAALDLKALLDGGSNLVRIGAEPGQDGEMMGNRIEGPTRIRTAGSGRVSLQCNEWVGLFEMRSDGESGPSSYEVMGNRFLAAAGFIIRGGDLTVVGNTFLGDLSLVADLDGGVKPVTIAGNQYDGRVSIRIRSAGGRFG
jgi:hypothetical protein